jgi:hypothetical protein
LSIIENEEVMMRRTNDNINAVASREYSRIQAGVSNVLG